MLVLLLDAEANASRKSSGGGRQQQAQTGTAMDIMRLSNMTRVG
jgi:hypothetical protein